MNQFWETAVFDNQYAPIKVYDIEAPKDSPKQNMCTVLTQNNKYTTKILTCCNYIHCHSFLELLFIRDNDVKVQLNGNIFYANYGDVFFINSYDIHDVDDTKGRWVFLIDTSKIHHLPKEIVNALFPNCIENKWIKSCETEKLNNLHSLCSSLIESLKSSKGRGSAKTTGLFYMLLDEIYTYTNSVRDMDTNPSSSQDNKLIYDILKYLEKNYTNEISLEGISHRVGFSKNYFCRFFKTFTGKPLVQFVNEMRCQRARDLLENSTQPITQIALDAGFSSTSYFSRRFKEYWGASPRQIRKQETIIRKPH